MSLEMCILASGSSGNCTIVRSPRGILMIDAGLSPRATARRLEGTGVSLDQIEAICLTHLDYDHFHQGWSQYLERQRIRLFSAPRHRRAVLAQLGTAMAGLVHEIPPQPFEPVPGVQAHTIDLRHDEDGSCGFVLDSGSARLGYATDLGRVPSQLIEAFAGVDLLAIESNYDPIMQLRSSRPQFLKSRIMGGRGHLSNHEAFAAVVRILDESARRFSRLPSHVALLHRSRQCNCPKLLRDLFLRDPRLVDRLILAEQHSRTDWISPGARQPLRGEQLALNWPASLRA
ncbi:MAG: MBL fold metallo-hydrolase [Phycisphaerae bacterium]|nr:MBL fold metallo-hydrolase [Phycisphaerae bacterium]MDW8261410.1 MBL fold metallo-hydrolase [Phycisphaerales bacterium]